MREFFFRPLCGFQPYEEVIEGTVNGELVTVFGMSEEQKNHLSAALHQSTGRPVLVVAGSEAAAARCYEDITQFVGEGVYLLPSREVAFYHVAASSRELTQRRIETLHAVSLNRAKIVVASAEAMQHGLMGKEGFLQYCLHLQPGDIVPPGDIAAALAKAGYERTERVDAKGQFSIRGGLLDVFAVNASGAVRIEWFDDEVDSIRAFEVSTQRSTENMMEVEIPPAAELLVESGEQAEYAVSRLQAALEETLEARGNQGTSISLSLWEEDDDELPSLEEAGQAAQMNLRPGSSEDKLAGRIRRNIESLQEGFAFANMEAYVPLLYQKVQTLADWMENPLVILDEPDKLRGQMENRRLQYEEDYKSALERGEALTAQSQVILSETEVLMRLTEQGGVLLSSFLRTMAGLSPKRIVKIEGVGATAYQSQFKDLCADLKGWRKEGWRVALLSGGQARGERLQKTLQEMGVSLPLAREEDEKELKAGQPVIYPFSLSHGFLYPDLKFAVISDADLYGTAYHKRKARKNVGERIAVFTDLKVGDYVVHESHGVGVYKGTVRLQSEGLWRDYLYIQYAGSDKLYVPTDQMDRVQRFIGAENGAPKINKLGGGEWQKQKQKVKSSIKEMAFDLVKLYAARKEENGFAFSPDTAWQRQFEDNFPFEETPDQLQAIEEIKKDMESPHIMDRLLCGDVGYGKTEVALRAAFKAVMDSKQVAVLVPTTILAQQHYNTIKERFKGFPVEVEVISRFKTPSEQTEILKRVREGKVDVLVGTHRLLAKDVEFSRLGLLVVDEEQRFGVQHKETIKNLRKNVDVLTLSATPIPRTLHMSMVGIRDMSVLETPPEERYPVQTYVLEYSDALVRDAILREINRGGQAYVLYNRVGNIDRFYAHLKELVPQARIAVGHGQMKEHALEDIMLDFYEGKYDVLLCTTIIESGVDVPNSNTLIVCDADRFGLSQLYQIRGRVGRSNRLAYAYLTVRPGRVLSETADKRLHAIRDFTNFGSGFRIAMRDLEIRGAGNLLGAEQHGFLSTVGYDMYCKLMEETVRELRGEMGDVTAIETRVEYPVDAFLPQEYVPSDMQRVELYKRIAAVDSDDARADLVEEMTDRYGDPPEQADQLLDIAQLKCACNSLGISMVTHSSGQVRMRFAESVKQDFGKLFAAVTAADRRLMFSATNPPALIMRGGGIPPRTLLKETVRAMMNVAREMKK